MQRACICIYTCTQATLSPSLFRGARTSDGLGPPNKQSQPVLSASRVRTAGSLRSPRRSGMVRTSGILGRIAVGWGKHDMGRYDGSRKATQSAPLEVCADVLDRCVLKLLCPAVTAAQSKPGGRQPALTGPGKDGGGRLRACESIQRRRGVLEAGVGSWFLVVGG
jgi:hypothetical protein